MQPNTSKITTSLLFVFGVVGLWRPKWISANVYKYYGIVIIFLFSFLLTLTMLINLIFLTDKSQLTDAMYMSFTEFALFLKICNFYWRNRSIQNLLALVKDFSLENADELKIYNKNIKTVFRIKLLNFVFTNLANFMLHARVLLSDEHLLTFPAWFPFDWQNNYRTYWCLFAYQLIGMILTSNLNVSIEMYPNFMFSMVSTQMKILNERLQNIGYTYDQKVEKSHNQHRALLALKGCIQTHQEILTLRNCEMKQCGLIL